MPELLEIAVAWAMEYFDNFKFHIGFLLILLIILELRLPEVFRRWWGGRGIIMKKRAKILTRLGIYIVFKMLKAHIV